MITIYNYCWQTIIVIYIDIKRKYPTLKVKILISFLQEKDKKHPIISKFYKGIEIKKAQKHTILPPDLQHFNNQQKFIFHFWDILGCKKFALGFYKKYFCLRKWV